MNGGQFKSTFATSAARSCLCSCADEATLPSEAADPTDIWLPLKSGCPLALTSASESFCPGALASERELFCPCALTSAREPCEPEREPCEPTSASAFFCRCPPTSASELLIAPDLAASKTCDPIPAAVLFRAAGPGPVEGFLSNPCLVPHRRL